MCLRLSHRVLSFACCAPKGRPAVDGRPPETGANCRPHCALLAPALGNRRRERLRRPPRHCQLRVSPEGSATTTGGWFFPRSALYRTCSHYFTAPALLPFRPPTPRMLSTGSSCWSGTPTTSLAAAPLSAPPLAGPWRSCCPSCPNGRRRRTTRRPSTKKPKRQSGLQSARLTRFKRPLWSSTSSNHRAPSQTFLNFSLRTCLLGRWTATLRGHGRGRRPPRHRGREGRHGAAARKKCHLSYMK